MTIKKMNYEECREDFFVNCIKHAENKIKYWKRQKGYHCEIDDNLAKAGAEINYCQDALKALKKQIPKKAIKVRSEIVCPNCKTLVGSSPYCRYCGQALDWS